SVGLPSHWFGDTVAVRVCRWNMSSSEALSGPTAIEALCLGSTSNFAAAFPPSTDTTCDLVPRECCTAIRTFCCFCSAAAICDASRDTTSTLMVILRDFVGLVFVGLLDQAQTGDEGQGCHVRRLHQYARPVTGEGVDRAGHRSDGSQFPRSGILEL